MEKLDNVAAAYVDESVTLYMKDDAAPDQEALTKMLAEHKIKVNGMKKTEKPLF